MNDDRKVKTKRLTIEIESWRKEKINIYKSYVETSAIGLEITISLLICIILGFLSDKYFNINPFGIISGAIIGMFTSGKILFNISKKYIDKNIKLENRKNNESDRKIKD